MAAVTPASVSPVYAVIGEVSPMPIAPSAVCTSTTRLISSVLIPLLIWNGRRYGALTTRVLIALIGPERRFGRAGNPTGCGTTLKSGSSGSQSGEKGLTVKTVNTASALCQRKVAPRCGWVSI